MVVEGGRTVARTINESKEYTVKIIIIIFTWTAYRMDG